MFPYVAVAVAGVACFVVGMLWFSPVMFGTLWMKAEGKTKKDCCPSAGVFIQAFLQGIVQIVALHGIAMMTRFLTLHECLMLAGWISLFVAAGMYCQVLWNKQSHVVYLINVGHCTVNIFLALLILFYGRSWGM